MECDPGFGEDSARLRFEEFAPRSDIYARVADELDVYFQRMDPLPVSKNEGVARALFMVRNLASSRRIAAQARRLSCLG